MNVQLTNNKLGNKKVFFVNIDGTLETIDDIPFLLKLGKVRRKRASHVIPYSIFKLMFFQLFRKIFGDKGRIADWTRTWKGKWMVDFSPTIGGLHGPFETREKALGYERLMLLKEMNK